MDISQKELDTAKVIIRVLEERKCLDDLVQDLRRFNRKN
jgi:hypothetical protein